VAGRAAGLSPAQDRQAPPTALIGVGASAGGVEALSQLVRLLPGDLGAAVFVVLHVRSSGTSALAEILDRAGRLPAKAAADGEAVRAGTVYVAVPDRHLLVREDTILLSSGPPEHGHRPAVDPTFRALAAYGPRAVGVILSGTRHDGTAGLATIKAAGGVALVQSPEEAAYDGMIQSAIANVAVNAVLSLADLASELARLSTPIARVG
jgi:two-component system chemotaxis response regulator CheB